MSVCCSVQYICVASFCRANRIVPFIMVPKDEKFQNIIFSRGPVTEKREGRRSEVSGSRNLHSVRQ